MAGSNCIYFTRKDLLCFQLESVAVVMHLKLSVIMFFFFRLLRSWSVSMVISTLRAMCVSAALTLTLVPVDTSNISCTIYQEASIKTLWTPSWTELSKVFRLLMIQWQQDTCISTAAFYSMLTSIEAQQLMHWTQMQEGNLSVHVLQVATEADEAGSYLLYM